MNSDATRKRAIEAARQPRYKTSVDAYHDTGEQGNFAVWNNTFDTARGSNFALPQVCDGIHGMPVVGRVEPLRGISGIDTALVILRTGQVVEVSDEGLVVWRNLEHWQTGSEPLHGYTFGGLQS